MPTFGKLEDGTPWVALDAGEEEAFEVHMPCKECGEEVYFPIKYFTDGDEGLPPVKCRKCGCHVEFKRTKVEDPLEKLSKEEAVDLLNAYDSYIVAGFDSGRIKSGWCPVCVREFLENEYRSVWLAGQSFDYMYEDGE
jgi:hypothetical protein